MNKGEMYGVPDRVLYCISHDLKTPLTAMMGYAVLLEQYCREPDRVVGYASKIQGAGAMLTAMINDVLEYAAEGASAMNMEAFDPVRVACEAAETLKMQIDQKNIDLQLVLPEKREISFIGDKTKMMRVLVNILSNSVKYTPANGRIRMTVQENERLEFLIEDNGVGMSESFVEKIFEPFAREGSTGEPGTGLGMYIVKTLVEDMGGSIETKSRPGKGTAVKVSL